MEQRLFLFIRCIYGKGPGILSKRNNIYVMHKSCLLSLPFYFFSPSPSPSPFPPDPGVVLPSNMSFILICPLPLGSGFGWFSLAFHPIYSTTIISTNHSHNATASRALTI